MREMPKHKRPAKEINPRTGRLVPLLHDSKPGVLPAEPEERQALPR